MINRYCVRILVLLLLHAALLHSAEAAFGSAEFKPSMEHPVGWRGDGSGRYPGANPPTSWSRRVTSGATANAHYQARKPKNENESGDAPRLELGIVKDWLVLGPFETQDPVAEIEKAFVADEAALKPDENDTAADKKWKAVHASVDTQSTHYTNEGTCQDYNVDFVFEYGRIDNQVGYAHTYVYSPNGGEVQLSIHRAGAAGKFWLNGKPTTLNPKDWSDIHKSNVVLKRGWNSLLVKLSCAQSTKPEGQNEWVSKWRFSIYFSAPLPATYEAKNIAWMTRLPGFSASAPVVAGERIFMTCGTSDLLCVNKDNGQIEWLTTLLPCDALSDADKAEPLYKEKVEPLIEPIQQANETLVKQINETNAVAGVERKTQESIDKAIKQKHELEKKLHDALKSIDKKKYPPMYENEVAGTNGTPITDGERVYTAVGGGMKGPGAYVIAAYSLDGKRIWSYFEALGSPEHGTHTSPALVDGKLIYGAQYHLLAFDPAKGSIVWRTMLSRSAQNCSACTFIPAKIGETPVLITHPAQLHLASDGKLTAELKNNYDFFAGETTPLAEGKFLYVNGSVSKKAFLAMKIAEKPDTPPALAWKIEAKDWRIETSSGFSIASSLIVEKLLYSVDTMGGLSVVDLAGQKLAYKRRLEMFQRANRQVWGFTASPTLGGKNAYFFDNTGSAVVLEPGSEYKELSKNIIENQVSSAWQDYKQELFYASPVFNGSSLYLKGSEYLYCIREK